MSPISADTRLHDAHPQPDSPHSVPLTGRNDAAPDLPPLYTKPAASTLLLILRHFALPPPSWDQPSVSACAPVGFERWLVSVIASPLHWIPDEGAQEAVKDLASERISELCGRSARGEMRRTFRIPLPGSSGATTTAAAATDHIEITLHEPSLTADNLGLKTWAAAYLLSKRLAKLPLPAASRALELGAGTGLVGLAAAALLRVPVLLTDLPEIVPNLARNIAANAHLGVEVAAGVLDWRERGARDAGEGYGLVLAADPLYSPEHPALLVGAIGRWLGRTGEARAVVEMPLREGYEKEREDFRARMVGRGLVVVEEGAETGWDDWGAKGGEVRCWWSVWRWGEALGEALGERV